MLAIATEEKAYQLRSEQVTTTIANRIKQQFGFIADPKKTLLHNASSALANTPTWYYFSRPSHLAFHDFTQQKQPAKNLCSLLGLGLKFIPTPQCTNIWKNLKKPQCPNSNVRSIYASILQEQPILQMSPMIQRCMYGPIGPPPPPPQHTHTHTGRDHLLSWKSTLKNSHSHWINYSKNELENQTSSHIRHAPCNNYNYNKISSFAPAIKT